MTADRPLSTWRFDGELRTSQRAVLDAMESPEVGDQWHIVAPPGSGKTLIGLLLAARRGERALVLAPTATIREQWVVAAKDLVPESPAGPAGPPPVSDEPGAPGDLTVLTYQMLSVVDTGDPFEELAREQWIAELVEGGREGVAARAWLDEMREGNARAYREGIRRRGRRVRRELTRRGAAELEQALHPNARALIARLVEHRVATVVLDECHHLLDHWALVIHCLVARLREAGVEPVLIGLTATLPSPEDQEEFENYTGLLGDVDYELPTPAVVKEGNLAPYRDLAWFVAPSRTELAFLKEHEKRLAEEIDGAFASEEGAAFLSSVLLSDDEEARLEQRLGQGYARDPIVSEAAARMLAQLRPGDRIVSLLGPEARTAPNLEQRIRLLARFALDRILPVPERAGEWQRIKRTLADFGYLLTDRGVRRGRDPIDTLLASSTSKDLAIGEILRLERSRESADEVRAVVVLDFAVHGHGKGRAAVPGEERAGALRCFGTVVADPSLADMRPILVTAQHLRIAARDAGVLLPRLNELLERPADAPLQCESPADDLEVLQLSAPGAGSARIVRAVSALIAEGASRLVVGTRGLLGEGWDCPAVNTLIDLSSVATSSATQQLRGRTLRLDPAWPEKVAHNWTVACVLDPGSSLDTNPEISRLARKHERIWGISRDGTVAVVRGLEHTLDPAQLRTLDGLLMSRKGQTAAKLNEASSDGLPSRPSTRRDWGIGEPYLAQVSDGVVLEQPERGVSPFRTPLTFEALIAVFAFVLVVIGVEGARVLKYGVNPFSIGAVVLIAALVIWQLWVPLRDAWRGFSYAALPRGAYEGAALAIARTLHARGDLPEYGRGNVRVALLGASGLGDAAASYEVVLSGGTRQQQRLVLGCLEELFGPIGSPRFLLEVGMTQLRWSRIISWLAARVGMLFGARSRYLAVPRQIGRRREDARRFADEWRRAVGGCVLHEIASPEHMALLTRARRRGAAPERRPRSREVWS